MNNQELFAAVYETNSDALFRYCFLRVSDREIAIDLVQESFSRLWISMNESAEIENNRAFLFRIARNLIIDHYRKKKTVSLDALAEEDENEYFMPKDISAQIQAEARYTIEQIQKLDPPYRQAVYLRLVEEMTPLEIAQITGESTNTISVRINRGISKLRDILGIENNKNG